MGSGTPDEGLDNGEEGAVEESPQNPDENAENIEITGEGGIPEAELLRMQAEVKDSREKYLRTLAEFDNYKKRSIKERSDLIKYQGDKLVADLLPVLDDLERALEFKDQDPKGLIDGLQMIQKLFIDTLQKWEIKAQPQIGKPFDPVVSAAISQIPAQEGQEVGSVINEFRKPYFYKDKLIRLGEAVVATEPKKSEG